MILFLYQWMLLLLVPTGFLQPASTFSKPHAHPFYVSVVEVAHNKANATLEISCKLFTEDAETVLEQQYKTSLDFAQPQQEEKIGGLLADYVAKHLKVTADKKAQNLRFVGFEQEAESLYGYFEVTNIPAVHMIQIHNNLLYDFTDKQINIMHVMVAGVRKSFKLDYPQTEASFEF